MGAAAAPASPGWIPSLAFQVLFYALTAVLAVAYLPLLALPRRWLVAAGRAWCRASLWLLRATVGLDHAARGEANRPAGPAIYAFKHQSAWDTLVVPILVADPAIVLKRELLWVPLFGQYLWRCGMIAVDRRAGAAALRRMVAGARAAAAAGRPIVVFPEGTRRPVGAPPAYQPGVAALYAALGLPVVPVALNAGVFWSRRAFRKRPGRITVSFLPAIPPGLDRRAFAARLAGAIEAETAQLVAHALEQNKNIDPGGDPP
ncbi:MAG: lysophospholipid acyltransferase family protein [Rhodospirillales bacterium]